MCVDLDEDHFRKGLAHRTITNIARITENKLLPPMDGPARGLFAQSLLKLGHICAELFTLFNEGPAPDSTCDQ